jgi:site-specific recombinase XerD
MCSSFAVFKEWDGDLAKRRSDATRRVYRYHAHRALGDLGADPATVAKHELKKYLGEKARPHANGCWSALNDLFGFLVRRGYRDDNPLEDAKRPPSRRRRLKRSLTHEELTRLLIAAVYLGEGRERWSGERMAWVILAHYSIGVRPGELARVSTSHLTLNGASSKVEIIDTKTGNDRIVPLNRTARIAFGELARGRSGLVLGIGTAAYWQKVALYGEHAELPEDKRRPYALRHSFARHLIEAGVSLPEVSALLGHTSLKHTIVYTEGDDAARRAAVLRLDSFQDPPRLFDLD